MLTAKVNFLVASNRLTEAKQHPDALKHLKQSMDELEKEYEAAKTKYESLQKDVEVRGHIHEQKENSSEQGPSPYAKPEAAD